MFFLQKNQTSMLSNKSILCN